MANKVAELAIHVTADIAGDVKSGFDDIGRGAVSMADDVESSTKRASSGVDRLGSASDGLDDKFGRAAGAAGALSSGADLIGNEKASAALQAMALATDFFSGVGQVGILVTQGLSAATVENEAATVSNTIATKAAAVGSKAWAIAQGVLNAVLAANPILLVVIGVVALVAAIKIAMDHSEKFRSIVQAVGKVGAAALRGVVNVVQDIVEWVVKVGDRFGILGTIVHAYVFLAKTEINIVITVIKGIIDVIGDVIGKFGTLKDKIVSVAGTIADKLSGIFQKVLNPVNTVKDALQDVFDLIGRIIDAISHIKVPHVDLNPFGRNAGVRSGDPAGSGASTSVTVEVAAGAVVINLASTGDSNLDAAAIADALQKAADRLGTTVLNYLTLGVPA